MLASLVLPAQMTHKRQDGKVRCFIGFQKTKNEYKETDVMLKALEQVAHRYPHCEIVKAESVPFFYLSEYDESSSSGFPNPLACTPLFKSASF